MNKGKYKLPMSASHLMLYISLGVFLGIAIFGVLVTIHFIFAAPEYVLELTIALFGYAGVIGGTAMGFYSNKAKAEYEISFSFRKYAERLNLATRICDMISDGKLSAESINLAKALISDSDTSIYTGPGGMAVEEQKYSASNPTTPEYSVEDILNERDVLSDINVGREY